MAEAVAALEDREVADQWKDMSDPFGKTRRFHTMKRDVRMLASMLIGAMQRLDFQPTPEEGLLDGLEMGRPGIKCKY